MLTLKNKPNREQNYQGCEKINLLTHRGISVTMDGVGLLGLYKG